MDDIARELGMSKKTIYQFYKEKDDLVSQLCDVELLAQEKMFCEVSEGSKDPIHEIMLLSTRMREMMQNINPLFFLDLQKFYPQAYKRFQKFKDECAYQNIFQNIKKGIEIGVYRKDLDADFISRYRLAQIDMLMFGNFFNYEKTSFYAVHESLLDMFVYGICTVKGHKLINNYKKLKKKNKTIYMKQYKKHLILSVMSLLLLKAQAQEPGGNSFSLQQAIEYSLKHSPNYLNSELDLKSAEYRKKEITGMGLPQVSGSIDLKDYLNIPTSLLPGQIFGYPAGTFIPVKFGTKYNSTVGISASQLIFSSDYIFGVKASDQFLNLSRIAINRTKSDVTAQVSKAYYNVIINRERVKYLDANIARLKKIMDDTRAYGKAGFVEQIDVERLEVQYNNLMSEREKTDRLIELSTNLLKFQMGYKLSDPIQLTDSLNVKNEVAESLPLLQADVSKRPEYQLLMAQQTLLDIDVERQKWSYMPTLAAYFSHNYNAQRQEFNLLSFDKNDPLKQWFKITIVGATLNLNIFTGFQRMNRLQQAKIASLKNQNMLTNVQLGAQMEANSASVSYNNAITSFSMQKKNIELAQHVYDVVQKKYQEGVGTNLEIVNAETSLKEAQTNYYNALFDMIVAKIDYQKATGTLVK